MKAHQAKPNGITSLWSESGCLSYISFISFNAFHNSFAWVVILPMILCRPNGFARISGSLLPFGSLSLSSLTALCRFISPVLSGFHSPLLSLVPFSSLWPWSIFECRKTIQFLLTRINRTANRALKCILHMHASCNPIKHSTRTLLHNMTEMKWNEAQASDQSRKSQNGRANFCIWTIKQITEEDLFNWFWLSVFSFTFIFFSFSC